MYQQIIAKIKPEFDKTADFFAKEISKIRTGQASPALVEDVMVEMYGQKMPLKQLGAIWCPQMRQILIQPWDTSYLEAIERALLQANMGVNPVVDKDVIRLSLPALSQEFRKNLLKILTEKAEEIKRVIRKWRDEAWSEIQTGAREGRIREDEKFKGKEELEKLVSEYNKKVENLMARKKQEIES